MEFLEKLKKKKHTEIVQSVRAIVEEPVSSTIPANITLPQTTTTIQSLRSLEVHLSTQDLKVVSEEKV